MKTIQRCRQLACTGTAMLLAVCFVSAQAPPQPESFSQYWRDHFRQDMQDFDSMILSQENGEDTGENRLGKKIKKMSEHRKLSILTAILTWLSWQIASKWNNSEFLESTVIAPMLFGSLYDQ